MISDMVALPRPALLGQGRSAALDYTDIDKLPSTKIKLNPRAGKTAAWEHQLKEILAGLHLSDTIHNSSPPTIEQVAHQLATSGYTMTMPQVHGWAQYVVGQWWSNSTTLYHIVYRSITLAGPFEEADLQMIQRCFWLGDYRHGYNLFQWATSHVVASSVASQSELMDKVAEMKLSSNPTYEVFAAHCSNLLMNWRNIASNDIQHPAQFYYRLLKSIPEMNDSSKLGQLRAWLSGRIADEHPSLADAVTFVDTFVKRASTIGLPKGSGQQLTALGTKGSGGDKKECKHCTSKLCRGGEFANTPLTCVCLNDKIGIPKSATEGQRKYVMNARSYAKVHSLDSLKHIKPDVIRAHRAPTVSALADNKDSDTNASPSAEPANPLADALKSLLVNEALKSANGDSAAHDSGKGIDPTLSLLLSHAMGNAPRLQPLIELPSADVQAAHEAPPSSITIDTAANDDHQVAAAECVTRVIDSVLASIADERVTSHAVPISLLRDEILYDAPISPATTQVQVIDCNWCDKQHSRLFICASQLGMDPESPPFDRSGGCGKSQHEFSCNCERKTYYAELERRRRIFVQHMGGIQQPTDGGASSTRLPDNIVNGSTLLMHSNADQGGPTPGQGGDSSGVDEASSDNADAYTAAELSQMQAHLQSMEERLRGEIQEAVLAAANAAPPSSAGAIQATGTVQVPSGTPAVNIGRQINFPPNTPATNIPPTQPFSMMTPQGALEAFNRGQLGNYVAQYFQPASRDNRLDLNSWRSTRDSAAPAADSPDMGPPDPSATWPGAMPEGRNPSDRLTTAELLARAQLAHSNAVRAMEKKIRKLEQTSRSYIRRFIEFLLKSVLRPFLSLKATQAILNMLDTKTIVILAFATYTFGPHLMPYLAKIAQATFKRIGSDAKNNISQWATERLRLVLQALILKLSIQVATTAQQTAGHEQELPAAAPAPLPEPVQSSAPAASQTAGPSDTGAPDGAKPTATPVVSIAPVVHVHQSPMVMPAPPPEPAAGTPAPLPEPVQPTAPAQSPAVPPDETTQAVPASLASKPVVGMHRQQVPLKSYRAPKQPRPTIAAAERMRNLQIAEANDLRREVDSLHAERRYQMQPGAGEDGNAREHRQQQPAPPRLHVDAASRCPMPLSDSQGYADADPRWYEQPTARLLPWEGPTDQWPKLPQDWGAERMARFEQKYLHLLGVGYDDEDASWGATWLSQGTEVPPGASMEDNMRPDRVYWSFMAQRWRERKHCTGAVAKRVLLMMQHKAREVQRISEQAVVAAKFAPSSACLCDNGATVDCSLTGIGRIENTFDSSDACSIAVGDAASSLVSKGSYYHAIYRIDSSGTRSPALIRMNDTPNGIADVFSEAQEVQRRGTTIGWKPGEGRKWVTSNGTTLILSMTPNNLGWLRIEPIVDQQLIAKLLTAAPDGARYVVAAIVRSVAPAPPPQERELSASAKSDSNNASHGSPPILATVDTSRAGALPASAVMQTLRSAVLRCMEQVHCRPLLSLEPFAVMDHATDALALYGRNAQLHLLGGPEVTVSRLVMPGVSSKSSHTGVSMGRAPQLTGVEILWRVHVLLGHAPFEDVIRTLMHSSGMRAGIITKQDIEAVIRAGCGICDSAKMRRRAFPHQPSDKTPPPVGKHWVMDELSLRVESAEHKYLYIIRFKNVLPEGKGKRRSYGLRSMDAAAIEATIQMLRAFVRPIHGEILVVKMDSHPSHRSKHIGDYVNDSGLRRDLSPPYVHEGVGDVEVTFQWDVPSANCLLMQSKPASLTAAQQEAHFFTAFLDVERSGNRIVKYDGKSRDMIYYGTDTPQGLTCMMAYGAPVKYLIHPEVRDSKFDEHAVAGVYRGPSRDDESEHRCWVSTNHGVLLRHVTVDIGCMRIDERAVLARCDRNHPEFQPFAIETVKPEAAPDFSRWLNPSQESYAVLDLWTSESPLPTGTTVLILGAGKSRDNDIRDWILKMRKRQISVVVIDKCLGGYEHDWTVPRVRDALCALAACEHVVRVAWAFSCSLWSALLCRPGPTSPLFTRAFPGGLQDKDGQLTDAAAAAVREIDNGLYVLRAAAQSSAEMIGESPPSRGKGSPFAFREAMYHDHVSQWEYPPLAAFLDEFGFTAVYADQGAAGGPKPKTSAMQVTKGLLKSAQTNLGTLVDTRRSTAAQFKEGEPNPDLGSYSITEQYPAEFARRIAATLLTGLPESSADKSPAEAGGAEPHVAQSPDQLPASVQRPRRAVSDVRYTKDGQVLQLTVSPARGSAYDELDPLGEHATTALVGRMAADQHQVAALATGEAGHESLYDLRGVVELVSQRTVLLEIGSGDIVQVGSHVAVVGADRVPVELDTKLAHTWHTPKNEREYQRSPQRSLWRTAAELKMEQYRSIGMFKLILESEVPPGYVIYDTLWARVIKFTGGLFEKLNPRWCLMGGNMDRSKYNSFSDTVRWATVMLIVTIRAAYDVVDFHFDISNAFQNTRTDEHARAPKTQRAARRLFCRQAPGFEERAPNGAKQVAEILVGFQGAIDAANLFGGEFIYDAVKDAGVRRCTWDRELFAMHFGPAVQHAGDLPKILAACSNRPAVDGAPPGWAVFGRHVDDGMGVASSQRVIDYLKSRIDLHWQMNISPWKKLIGFDCTINVLPASTADPERTSITLSAIEPMRRMFKHHVEDRMLIQPRHPYAGDIDESPWGEEPATGSPEHAEFKAMQAKAASGIGWSIWGMRVHPNLIYPTVRLCGHMANLSYKDYKHWQHNIMHELAHPRPLIIGPFPKISLSISDRVIRPFSSPVPDMGLHFFVDASLGYPRAADGVDEAPISAGITNVRSHDGAKSITGIMGFLFGSPVFLLMQRQQLVSPDSTSSEIHAAGTAVCNAIIVANVLQEMDIPQVRPTPVFCDSQSTVFVANDAAAAKKSIWVSRRAAVLREAVDDGTIDFIKIPREDNVADYLTRPVTHAEYLHFAAYIWPEPNPQAP